jgi:hypothetical protein
MDMKNEITYTVVAYNHACIERIISVCVYKTSRKAEETNNYLTFSLHHKPFTYVRAAFNETVEKGKTYYSFDGEQRAIATNRTSPIEALRDAFNLLAQKRPTEFKPHYLSTAMGKIINTLRRMYQEENIASVSFIMMQDQKYLLACQNTDGNRIMVHDDLTY